MKYIRLKHLITIVLLGCSINLSASNSIKSNNLSTGGVVYQVEDSKDSVLISYDDLRIVNSKLTELNYEKQINSKLRSIIVNDSIIIKNYKNNVTNLNNINKKAIKQRNIAVGSGILFFITSLLLLMK